MTPASRIEEAAKDAFPLPWDNHQQMWVLRQNFIDAAKFGYKLAIEDAVERCCTIDSSDISHDTAEMNASAIRELLKGVE